MFFVSKGVAAGAATFRANQLDLCIGDAVDWNTEGEFYRISDEDIAALLECPTSAASISQASAVASRTSAKKPKGAVACASSVLQSAKDSKSAKQKFSEDLTDYLAVPGNLNKFQQAMTTKSYCFKIKASIKLFCLALSNAAFTLKSRIVEMFDEGKIIATACFITY